MSEKIPPMFVVEGVLYSPRVVAQRLIAHEAMAACLSAALAVLKASSDQDARQLIADIAAALKSYRGEAP